MLVSFFSVDVYLKINTAMKMFVFMRKCVALHLYEMRWDDTAYITDRASQTRRQNMSWTGGVAKGLSRIEDRTRAKSNNYKLTGWSMDRYFRMYHDFFNKWIIFTDRTEFILCISYIKIKIKQSDEIRKMLPFPVMQSLKPGKCILWYSLSGFSWLYPKSILYSTLGSAYWYDVIWSV